MPNSKQERLDVQQQLYRQKRRDFFLLQLRQTPHFFRVPFLPNPTPISFSFQYSSIIYDFQNFFEKKLKIDDPQVWYSYHVKNLVKIPSQGKLFYYIKLIEFLKLIYPQISWDPKKFSNSRNSHVVTWSNQKYVQNFLENLGNFLEIKKLEDWYEVDRCQTL
eukprot:TRINITY_DN9550_c0_g1_i9.p2 TRINITY_DN9550_c0_g1~~TRINITY_DN9550_c0_g1_i9.p2  ORF type:complete len:162 (-),score=37.16 TRINITY_DN9550_c0_g1_i9:265-750(-)